MHIRMHYLWYFDTISKTGDADVFTHRLTSIFAIFFRAYASHLAIQPGEQVKGAVFGAHYGLKKIKKKGCRRNKRATEALIAEVKANHRAISLRSRMTAHSRRVRRVMPIIRQAHWARVGGRVFSRELGYRRSARLGGRMLRI